MATPLYTKIPYDEYRLLNRELAYWKMKCQMSDQRIRQLTDEIKRLKK